MNDLETIGKEFTIPQFEALSISIWEDRVRSRKTCKNLASESEPGILRMRIRMDVCKLERSNATPIIPYSYFSTLNLFRCMSRFSG